MLSRAILVAALLFVSGCAVGERPVLTDDALEDSNGLDGGASAATIGTSVTTTAPIGGGTDASGVESEGLLDPGTLGDAPPILVTANGIVVPVIGRSDEGYLVRTPCGNDVEILWGQALGPVDVVLDPGHGGEDEKGAIGPSGETEAEVNLDVARRAARLLEVRGFSVSLTRTSDYRIAIPVRAAIAERLQPSAFVSIHHNAPSPDISENRSAPGTEVYTQVGSDDSRRLGGLLYDRTIAELSVFDAEWASRTDAGVLNVLNDEGDDAYGIVRRPSVPTALIEMAYLSNPTEALVIGTAEYRQAAANAVAEGVASFLETADEGSGYVDEPRLFNPSAATGGSDGCLDPPLG